MEPIESSETSAYINTMTPGTYPKETTTTSYFIWSWVGGGNSLNNDKTSSASRAVLDAKLHVPKFMEVAAFVLLGTDCYGYV